MNNPIESKPLFAVGEVVILQSYEFPHMSGEDTVLAIVEPGDKGICPLTGNGILNSSLFVGYFLESNHPSAFNNGCAALWVEKCLRKRHQPGEYNWQDLKTILYLPQSRDEIARLERESCNG